MHVYPPSNVMSSCVGPTPPVVRMKSYLGDSLLTSSAITARPSGTTDT